MKAEARDLKPQPGGVLHNNTTDYTDWSCFYNYNSPFWLH